MKVIIDEKLVDEVLDRGTIKEIFPTKDEFKKKLLSGQKMRFYIGFDATAPTLHLSHAKNLILLEKFRKLGHEVIMLFGDFTARIGDPSGLDTKRKQLSRKDVLHNIKIWKKLVKPLMGFSDFKNPPKIKYNHKWLSRLNFEKLIGLASNFTVQQMIERDMFQKRLSEGKPIHLHEFLYPLMQGYDSVAMNVDVELCGTDQIFNALTGRTLLKKLKNKNKFVVAVTLMENPKTGELMSKSKGTGVFLDAVPNDMFGQIMAQKDEMIEVLFVNNTYLSLEEIKNIMAENNPRDAKIILAREIVKIFYGGSEASKAEKNFINTFQKKEIPDEKEEINCGAGELLGDVLVKNKILSSKGEWRRLVLGKGIHDLVENKNILDVNFKIGEDLTLKIGKKRFLKIKI
ncbi:tyrosine--tRNA ligase [Patescibacteria group bacterium]|nr:tyrosine--tRNA ligase [Patescibacteria group bacterium]